MVAKTLAPPTPVALAGGHLKGGGGHPPSGGEGGQTPRWRGNASNRHQRRWYTTPPSEGGLLETAKRGGGTPARQLGGWYLETPSGGELHHGPHARGWRLILIQIRLTTTNGGQGILSQIETEDFFFTRAGHRPPTPQQWGASACLVTTPPH